MHCFSQTGGIEKVCRVLAHALEGTTSLTLFSLHDGRQNTRPYVENADFKGFSGKRLRFIFAAVKKGVKADVVLISHINLALPALMIKLLQPKVKLIVLAHGIEIWAKPVSKWKRKVLQNANEVVAVSNFTSAKLWEQFAVKSRVINNCLDPFLPEISENARDKMRLKYGLTEKDLVVLTLSRLSKDEQNKGYDSVVRALGELRQKGFAVKYVFAGKYQEVEKVRLEELASLHGMEKHLVFTGFVPDNDLGSLFKMADVYIMPSRKEGFGISFIEAMYYGLPVIAGNADGSVDALLGGRLGLLVNPGDFEEIVQALEKVLREPLAFVPDAALLQEYFGFETYKKKWEEVLLW